jgi:small subunit ribosomal protein S16
MVSLRFTRVGRKSYATYRIVAIDSRRSRDSKAIEYLGSYNPHTKELSLQKDRVEYWLSVGAKPTKTVHRLLAKQGLMEAPAKKIFKKKPGKKAQERAAKKEEASVSEEVKKEENES